MEGGYKIEISEELGVARIEIEPPLEPVHEQSLVEALSIEEGSFIRDEERSAIEIEQLDTDPEDDPYDLQERQRIITEDELKQAQRIGKVLTNNCGIEVNINPQVKTLDQDQQLIAA
jgi:hypothetical protein